jgi:hypothetical protein
MLRRSVLTMGSVNSSETSVSIYQTTRRSILEDTRLYTNHLVNMKSDLVKLYEVATL